MAEPRFDREGVKGEAGVRYPWIYLAMVLVALVLVAWALFFDGPSWLGLVAVVIIVASLFFRPRGAWGRKTG